LAKIVYGDRIGKTSKLIFFAPARLPASRPAAGFGNPAGANCGAILLQLRDILDSVIGQAIRPFP
jgi:hypothetical protein